MIFDDKFFQTSKYLLKHPELIRKVMSMSIAEFKISLRKFLDNRKVTSLDIEHLGQINGLLSRLENEKRFMKRLKMFGVEETEILANAIKQYLLYG